ncbi:MAG: PHP domain-containing protein [Bacteroidales bacterium]|nr:PHP domain-containing protein [Bacteroidales bacterium]MDD2424683.1 PHP domain-containing protein [Bacteroidales bacterium]MDD3989869.1 PHP domain-containing protein [Bacteroidales bacterium]MDD4638439.1 PHP domain-containing protein [Bacteroidales bacterium]
MIRADLHIHTVLSPCGDLEMTPLNIIKKARERSLGIIGITDHNSTLQCGEIRRIGEREGISVLCGAEITTKEEVHVVCLVDTDKLATLQEYLNKYLPPVPNKTDFFGYQLVVNEDEEVLYQEPYLLISAINQSINQVEAFIHSLGGLFIPAHIDKRQNSILSQLGFFPPDLKADAVELSVNCNLQEFVKNNTFLAGRGIITSSDAHYPEDIGSAYTLLNLDTPDSGEISFENVKKAILKLAV